MKSVSIQHVRTSHHASSSCWILIISPCGSLTLITRRPKQVHALVLLPGFAGVFQARAPCRSDVESASVPPSRVAAVRFPGHYFSRLHPAACVCGVALALACVNNAVTSVLLPWRWGIGGVGEGAMRTCEWVDGDKEDKCICIPLKMRRSQARGSLLCFRPQMVNESRTVWFNHHDTVALVTQHLFSRNTKFNVADHLL